MTSVAVMPAGVVAGSQIQHETPDGRVLNLTIPAGVLAGSILNLVQDSPAGKWRCLVRESTEPIELALSPGPMRTTPISELHRTISVRVPLEAKPGSTFKHTLADGVALELIVPSVLAGSCLTLGKERESGEWYCKGVAAPASRTATSIIVPEGVHPGCLMYHTLADGSQLNFVLPEEACSGSVLVLTQHEVTKQWTCVVEFHDVIDCHDVAIDARGHPEQFAAKCSALALEPPFERARHAANSLASDCSSSSQSDDDSELTAINRDWRVRRTTVIDAEITDPDVLAWSTSDVEPEIQDIDELEFVAFSSNHDQGQFGNLQHDDATPLTMTMKLWLENRAAESTKHDDAGYEDIDEGNRFSGSQEVRREISASRGATGRISADTPAGSNLGEVFWNMGTRLQAGVLDQERKWELSDRLTRLVDQTRFQETLINEEQIRDVGNRLANLIDQDGVRGVGNLLGLGAVFGLETRSGLSRAASHMSLASDVQTDDDLDSSAEDIDMLGHSKSVLAQRTFKIGDTIQMQATVSYRLYELEQGLHGQILQISEDDHAWVSWSDGRQKWLRQEQFPQANVIREEAAPASVARLPSLLVRPRVPSSLHK